MTLFVSPMSHYDCVLPVDFERLQDVVLPAWIEFIAGERAPRDFADEFVPWQVGVADSEYWPEDSWLEPFDLAPDYIDWFRARSVTEWNAEAMRREVGPSMTSDSLPWCADDLLTLAIKQSCAVEIPGESAFPELEFYNRLHEPPRVQVAGTKNRFWFLEELYDWDWKQCEWLYLVRRKGVIEESAYDLLEKLFFNIRIFPGTEPMKKSLVWKASDESQIPGFLTREETRELAYALPQLNAAIVNTQDKSWKFEQFADVLLRSARCDAGLVTLFSGL